MHLPIIQRNQMSNLTPPYAILEFVMVPLKLIRTEIHPGSILDLDGSAPFKTANIDRKADEKFLKWDSSSKTKGIKALAFAFVRIKRKAMMNDLPDRKS